MNDELFRPHGLYCFIMAYDRNLYNKLVQDDSEVDPGRHIAKPVEPSGSHGNFRSDDGTVCEGDFPVLAQLIHPVPSEPPSPYEDEDEEEREEEQEEEDRNASDSESEKGSENPFTTMLAKAVARYESRKDLKAQRKFVCDFHARL
jgi:hypothetical protein